MEFLQEYGYLGILVWTMLEGETIVFIAGIAASQGFLQVEYIFLAAWTGGFIGDQIYYTIGRRYGMPILDKRPHLSKRAEWAFRLVRRYQIPFILTYRYLYGIRNAAPFVIGISGVSRLRFAILNLIACGMWAASFAYGGYYFGAAVEAALGEYKLLALGLFVAVGLITGGIVSIRRRRSRERAASAEAESAATQPAEGRQEAA